ncbi:MAG: endolytic transglycosylase MltG [Desulfovibrionaceae bacterium]|nr:endolytic transglycosylase MltG [Desulfovibrionaceae bacterium]
MSDLPESPTPSGDTTVQTPSKKRRRWLLWLALVIIAGAAAAGAEAYRFVHSPASDAEKNIVLEINPGESFDTVARRLHNAGAVSSVFKFKILARLRGETGNIQAGVFEFSTGWTPIEVLHQMVYGKPTLERLTIREGLPWWEVARAVERQGFARAEDFTAVIHDPQFLADMGIPFANAEGFLYPDTYFLKKPPEELTRKEARQIAARMVDTFWQRGSRLWGDKRPGKDELFHLVTLASLVEKETGVPAERARVAGVYANRLRAGMLLQCDPTIIYGLGEKYDGRLRRRHLEDSANTYNTYKHPGLPPGPICSPGLAALQAAHEPEAHKFYYFVATGKPDGTHYFNTNLNAHNRDVKKYLAELKRRKAEARRREKEKHDIVEAGNSTAPSDSSPAVEMKELAE